MRGEFLLPGRGFLGWVSDVTTELFGHFSRARLKTRLEHQGSCHLEFSFNVLGDFTSCTNKKGQNAKNAEHLEIPRRREGCETIYAGGNEYGVVEHQR